MARKKYDYSIIYAYYVLISKAKKCSSYGHRAGGLIQQQLHVIRMEVEIRR